MHRSIPVDMSRELQTDEDIQMSLASSSSGYTSRVLERAKSFSVSNTSSWSEAQIHVLEKKCAETFIRDELRQKAPRGCTKFWLLQLFEDSHSFEHPNLLVWRHFPRG